MNITEIAKLLETYSERDKIIRLLCYSSKWGASITSSPTRSQKLDKFSNQLSACRALLRLFDDIPMLHCTLSYGLGKQEKDNVLRFLDLTTNIVDQAYFPIEHMSWAIENDFLSVKSNPWSTSSTVFWVISIYLGLMRNIRCLMVLQYHKKCLKGVDCNGSTAMPQLMVQQQRYLLSAVKCTLDLVHAINCLPEGYLWGGKLLKWQERKRLEAEKITHVLIEELLTNMPEPQDLFDVREEARNEEYGEISEEITGEAMSDIDPHNTEQYGEQN